MKKQDFYFDLPEALIAQYPLPNRRDSRLLVYERLSNNSTHHQFKDLLQFLQAGDLLVMNNSKVIPARIYGKKSTGGKVELLLERKEDEHTFWAHIRASKSPKIGTVIILEQKKQVQVKFKHNDLYLCETEEDIEEMFQQIGHIPLPPYIKREDELSDQERYQTVYAKHLGSVAAPTAGLHFDNNMLEEIQKKGVKIAFSTLHVGSGTFQPLRCDNILDHQMHEEWFEISTELAEEVNNTRRKGNKVIAVGTTALRSLESGAREGVLKPMKESTKIFIYPGYKFQICDGLLTNFHLPESTLLMLVSAFIGYDNAMALYQEAIREGYRFFSYGDTSLLL